MTFAALSRIEQALVNPITPPESSPQPDNQVTVSAPRRSRRKASPTVSADDGTGIAKKSVILNEAESEIKDTLQTNFGKDSSKFGDLFENDSSSTRVYAQVKVKDLWSAIEALGIMISYDITLVNITDAVNLNDFVYLDVDNSTFTLDYP